MLRSIPVTHLLAAIVTLSVARACYYYYYIEDPNNFAYRYCSVGVSLFVSCECHALPATHGKGAPRKRRG